MQRVRQDRRTRGGLAVPERAKRFPADRFLEPAQWETFWPLVHDARMRLYFDLLQSAGFRAHEGLLINERDIDFGGGYVITRLLKRKTKEERPIPVRPDIIAKLHLLSLPFFPFTYRDAYHCFKKVTNELNLSPKLALHSLRHLATTRFVEADATDRDIGYLLRHVAHDVTAAYGQVSHRRLRLLAEKTWETQTWIWKKKE